MDEKQQAKSLLFLLKHLKCWACWRVTLAFAVGASAGHFLGPHNPISQIAEQVIQAETGLSVDLD